MKRPHLLIFLLLLCAVDIVRAQGDFLSRRVSFEYKNTRLKEVLNSISEKYNIKFSYSSRVINVRQRISAKATDVPLSAGLDTLFAPTPIVYSLIGHHIVLKNDPGKLLGHREMKQPRLPDSEDTGKPDTSAVLVYAKQPPAEERPRPDSAIAIEMPASRPVKRQGRMYPFDQTLLNLEKWRTRAEYALRPSNNRRLARVSLLPHISTNPDSGPGTTNNISINVLWAKSGGVDGLEAGGLVNRVNRDVIGVQLAGLGNSVGGNVTGTQVAGVFNKNDGMTRGLQAAGLINIARHLQAAQAAGAVNWAKGNMAGLQISLLLNRTAGQVRGLQVAGLMNLSGGQSKAQIAGLFNKADEVAIFQGGLINVATGRVNGLQLGLINISDTVGGVPVGLINIVKRGYNHIEIYGSEIFHGNIQLKIGANHFYNIFQIGAQVPPGNGSYIWGIGYGIGTLLRVSAKNQLNWEIMALHINENEGWTNTLNSIGQFRFLCNHQLGKSIGFFFGPTANVMISQLKDPETNRINSPLVPYSLINTNPNPDTNLRAWIGVNAGFSF